LWTGGDEWREARALGRGRRWGLAHVHTISYRIARNSGGVLRRTPCESKPCILERVLARFFEGRQDICTYDTLNARFQACEGELTFLNLDEITKWDAGI